MSKASDFIRDYTKRCSNATVGWNKGESEVLYQPWLTPENALAAVELEKEKVIEKACDWLSAHDSYVTPTNVKVEELRKYLKGE